MNKLRNFLDKNKIIFETIAATSLTIMAIIVSIQSNRIAEKQTIIANQELLPKFHIVIKQLYDSKLNYYSGQSVQVYNEGNNFDNFYANGFSFLELTLEDTVASKVIKEKIRLMPFYSYQSITSDYTKGFIRELRTDNFYIDKNKMISYCERNKKILKQWKLTEIELKHYIKLSFLSLLKERIIYYYDIHLLEGQLLDDKIGQEIFEEYESNNDMRGVLKLNDNEQAVVEKLKIISKQLEEK